MCYTEFVRLFNASLQRGVSFFPLKKKKEKKRTPLALLRSMWDLSSLTRDQTPVPAMEAQSLTRGTTRKVLPLIFLVFKMYTIKA